MRKALLDDLGLRGEVCPDMLEKTWVDPFERSKHVRVFMSISYILEKSSNVFLHFDYSFCTTYVCFSIVLETLGLVEEFGSFVCLKGLELIHL